MKTPVAVFLALSVLLWPSCKKSGTADMGDIKAYDIDFNWGEGGPNGLQHPGYGPMLIPLHM